MITIEKKRKSKDVYICEVCGREYEGRVPFPEGCKCGNYCEDFFRVKDRFDGEDDLAGRPLHGIRYDSDVLRQREKKLKDSAATQKNALLQKVIITQPISEVDIQIKKKIKIKVGIQAKKKGKSSSKKKGKDTPKQKRSKR